MSDKTSIEWAESTWNPIRGTAGRHTCARISPGCDNCYAATMNRRGLMGTAPLDYGQGETLLDPAQLDEKALMQPLSWKKPRKVFVCSMTDLFGTWVPAEWIARIISVMAECRQHTFIVLTKRPTRMRDMLSTLAHNVEVAYLPKFWPLPNVWVGVTIESDQYAWRANRLRETPAAVRWISAEPLLSGLPSLDLTGIDWLVTGGESGPKARPMYPQWARDLRDQCQESGTAYFFKQHGAWVSRHDAEAFEPLKPASIHPHQCCWVSPSGETRPVGEALMTAGDELMTRLGNHRTGRILDRRTWDDYPAVAGGAP